MEIGDVHEVAIDDRELAQTRTREQVRTGAAQSANANDQGVRRAKIRLRGRIPEWEPALAGVSWVFA
jgi:hypothetical protein